MRNVNGRYLRDVSSWRKIAAVAWRPPQEPMIYAGLDVDFTNARRHLARQAERCDEACSVTHLVVQAIARTLRKHPECNGLIRRNKIYLRDRVDVSVLVAIGNDTVNDQQADLSNTVVREADRKSLQEIASDVRKGARSVRRHEDVQLEHTKKLFQILPPALLKRALRVTSRIEYQWNFDLHRLGVPRDAFGSLLVTSLGPLGLRDAWAPIPPFSGVPMVVAVGEVEDEPVAVDGQIVIRPILPLRATIDHRLIDGFQGARLAKTLRRYLENPETLLN
jgi:pyruvate dehydrogenase E2 component (dihydrolipoamide acetyltransferase)